MKFEQSAARIDDIIRSLENDNISLEDSLSLYQEGVRLLSGCREELRQAELSVKVVDDE